MSVCALCSLELYVYKSPLANRGGSRGGWGKLDGWGCSSCEIPLSFQVASWETAKLHVSHNSGSGRSKESSAFCSVGFRSGRVPSYAM